MTASHSNVGDVHPSEKDLYSVVNGKLMRATATSRVEVMATEASKLLNRLTRQLQEERQNHPDRAMSWQEATQEAAIFGRHCAACKYVCLEDWKLCPMCGCTSRYGDPFRCLWGPTKVHSEAEPAPAADPREPDCCCAEAGGGLVCTLPKKHTGRHEAWGARKNLLQSWSTGDVT